MYVYKKKVLFSLVAGPGRAPSLLVAGPLKKELFICGFPNDQLDVNKVLQHILWNLSIKVLPTTVSG